MIPDDSIRHQYCPEQSYWEYKKEGTKSKKAHYLHECFLELLLPIYETNTSYQMFQRMIAGMNSNNLENANSVLWSILGESKYHGTR